MIDNLTEVFKERGDISTAVAEHSNNPSASILNLVVQRQVVEFAANNSKWQGCIRPHGLRPTGRREKVEGNRSDGKAEAHCVV